MPSRCSPHTPTRSCSPVAPTPWSPSTKGTCASAHGDRPATVVAIDRVAELRSWTVDPAARAVTLGAGVPYTELMREPLASLLPALAEASRTVGSPQIRNAGTLGGNLGTCSPAGDGPAGALGPRRRGASRLGRRAPIDAGPRVHGGGEAHCAATGRADRRGHGAVARRLAGIRQGGRSQRHGDRHRQRLPRGAHPRPVGAHRARFGGPHHHPLHRGRGVRGRAVDWDTSTVTPDLAARFGDLVAAASRPIDDHRSTAAYRRHAVGVLGRRLLRRAFPTGEAAR
jgi:hypothetical protein